MCLWKLLHYRFLPRNMLLLPLFSSAGKNACWSPVPPCHSPALKRQKQGYCFPTSKGDALPTSCEAAFCGSTSCKNPSPFFIQEIPRQPGDSRLSSSPQNHLPCCKITPPRFTLEFRHKESLSFYFVISSFVLFLLPVLL